jgi:hypothetical protein
VHVHTAGVNCASANQKHLCGLTKLDVVEVVRQAALSSGLGRGKLVVTSSLEFYCVLGDAVREHVVNVDPQSVFVEDKQLDRDISLLLYSMSFLQVVRNKLSNLASVVFHHSCDLLALFSMRNRLQVPKALLAPRAKDPHRFKYLLYFKVDLFGCCLTLAEGLGTTEDLVVGDALFAEESVAHSALESVGRSFVRVFGLHKQVAKRAEEVVEGDLHLAGCQNLGLFWGLQHLI